MIRECPSLILVSHGLGERSGGDTNALVIGVVNAVEAFEERVAEDEVET